MQHNKYPNQLSYCHPDAVFSFTDNDVALLSKTYLNVILDLSML